MAIPLDLSVIGMLGIILLIGRAVHAGRFRARARAELRKESGGVDLSAMRAGFPAHPDDYHGGLLGGGSPDAHWLHPGSMIPAQTKV
jgi:hypothetical protein